MQRAFGASVHLAGSAQGVKWTSHVGHMRASAGSTFQWHCMPFAATRSLTIFALCPFSTSCHAEAGACCLTLLEHPLFHSYPFLSISRWHRWDAACQQAPCTVAMLLRDASPFKATARCTASIDPSFLPSQQHCVAASVPAEWGGPPGSGAMLLCS